MPSTPQIESSLSAAAREVHSFADAHAVIAKLKAQLKFEQTRNAALNLEVNSPPEELALWHKF